VLTPFTCAPFCLGCSWVAGEEAEQGAAGSVHQAGHRGRGECNQEQAELSALLLPLSRPPSSSAHIHSVGLRASGLKRDLRRVAGGAGRVVWDGGAAGGAWQMAAWRRG